jgi:hypothetical protein
LWQGEAAADLMNRRPVTRLPTDKVVFNVFHDPRSSQPGRSALSRTRTQLPESPTAWAILLANQLPGMIVVPIIAAGEYSTALPPILCLFFRIGLL